MTNNRKDDRQNLPRTEPANRGDENPREQFNELSELSLEERMNVADQIGIPVENAGDAAAIGTISGPDPAEELLAEGRQEESTAGETNH